MLNYSFYKIEHFWLYASKAFSRYLFYYSWSREHIGHNWAETDDHLS